MSFSEYFRVHRRFPAWGSVLPAFPVQFAAILTLHAAALIVMATTEVAVIPKLVFLLAWGILNFFWLMMSRRPTVSAALSLAMIVALVLVSRLKHDILLITVNFVDHQRANQRRFAILSRDPEPLKPCNRCNST